MKLMTLAMVAIGISGAQPATVQPKSPGEASLVEFADRFDQAQIHKDGAALERMVGDDLVFITGSGKRQGKKEFIAGWTDPGDTYDPITLTDRVITMLGPDAGMASAETVLSGTSGGEKFSSHFRFTDTFRRVAGKWQAVHIQVTRIPD